MQIAVKSQTRKVTLDRTASLPKSWHIAAGLLQHKTKSLQAHLRQIRKEWSAP